MCDTFTASTQNLALIACFSEKEKETKEKETISINKKTSTGTCGLDDGVE